MATILEHPTSARTSPVERYVVEQVAERAAEGHGEISDRQAGYYAVVVIGALGLFLLTLITTIAIYAGSWGYSIQF
jgi:hypothetical protein